ncbi:soluble lytic murein transglycosylase-like protein [Duganella sp. SG902]|uniref:transglycosylase SLT domain-containing protein n=1 Tax=Duganella sp. SG902 TaxID=2587016 RepID=UPI0017D4598B|nr:lytic transglycosylase domain-containing protein [Duganella sp. SG902]NVM78885.1 soluble lytic murein transglycosylase-like protein [Duganella sp. SG902]
MLRALRQHAAIVLAAAMCLAIVPGAEASVAVPRSANAYRAELTRIAHSTWGMDAPIPVFAAQIHQESGWNPAAVSRVGARGMSQFMPATATWWCHLVGLTTADCQPNNPTWAMRSLVGYDRWLFDRVVGATLYDRLWAMLRSYNGGLGHWQKEASTATNLTHGAVDAQCGRASRAALHCAENLGYPQRILVTLQSAYAGWGAVVTEGI